MHIINKEEALEIIQHLKKLNLSFQGEPVTEDLYDEMLGAVPPIAQSGGAFLVGEIFDYTPDGEALYQLFFTDKTGYYYFKPCTLNFFNQIFLF